MADTTPLPLSRLRARLAAPRGKRRLDEILAADSPEQEVAALSPLEVYQLVHQVGFADAMELVALATPEQLQGCLDLDAWTGDELQLEATLPWLSALVEAGHDKLGQVWERLDPELTALILSRTTHIYDLSLGEEPDDPGDQPVLMTPDTYFALRLVSGEDDTVRLIHRIIEDLYRADPSGALARHTIMAARSEPPAELEEMSYRWRSGRMADLGYVEIHEALEVFRPLDPASVTIGEGSEDRFGPRLDEPAAGPLPVPIAERVAGKSFLSRALHAIDDPAELERLELALVVLVNKVLAAARISPGDREGMDLGAAHATATLALGLEAVSQGDLARATRALGTIALGRLHRLGYTLTLRLARLARALAPRALTAGPPVDALITALSGRHPLFPRALDPAPAAADDVRPFESMDDVRVVAETLTQLTLRMAIATDLGVDLTAMAARPEPRPALDDHVRTALVRAMLGQPPGPAPLTAAELARFRATAMTGGAITAPARQAAGHALVTRLDAAGITAARAYLPALLEGWLADLDDALGALQGDPDPRFVDRVLIAARRS